MNLHPNQKIAGVLIPLFSIRGSLDLGIGDTSALEEAIVWAQENGFHALQLLPINESGTSNSPYSVTSAMALEPSTITTHPSWIPELKSETYDLILASYDLVSLRNGPVNYPLVRKLKRELLTSAWESFKNHFSTSERAKDYKLFQEEQSWWLPDYTLYRVLLERHGENDDLPSWEAPLQQASTAHAWLDQRSAEEQKNLKERRDFFSYVQWIAFEQWKKIRNFADEYNVALIGDVPTGVNLGSADVFSAPELFDLTTFGGAPPEKVFRADPFTMQWGQNWGIPLYRWEKMSRDNFFWWRHRLRHLRSLFHLLRIDHALGLFRIYSFPWKPENDAQFIDLSHEAAKKITGGRLPQFIDCDDETPEHRAHNQRRGEMLLHLFLEEAGPDHLIAEDLGETPSYVPESLEKLQIPGFKIPLWIRDHQGQMLPPQEYPRVSVATYATHDHEPFRKQWETWQAEAQSEDPSSGRWKTLTEMLAFIGCEHEDPMTLYSGKIHEQLIKGLYATNSWLAIVMITDFFGSKQQFNTPGSPSSQNWQERISLPISEWNENFREILTASHEELQASGRLLPTSVVSAPLPNK
ncbi:MAG: 4-alpha-glucanotransferase [Verrucomicrobiae bacterium]|nr:4-alpha-glucanotransferase [Verrucomicrobiae bacterium]